MKITNLHTAMTEFDFLDSLKRRDNFVKPQKGDGDIAASLQISEDAQKRFDAAIQPLKRERLDIPEYCGIYKTDKAIATALENCLKEDRIFVYDIIRQNFLKENTSSMTEEERQANISLGMKKAEYAAENFIPEDQKEAFLNAMNTIAKIAGAGKANANGDMDYGVKKATYLGHGSGLVEVTNDEDVMRTLDSEAYEEYCRIGEEDGDEPLERFRRQTKFLHDWMDQMRKKDPDFIRKYEEKTTNYMKKYVDGQEVDSTFADIDVSSKESFLHGLKAFMDKNTNFLKDILFAEINKAFWFR